MIGVIGESIRVGLNTEKRFIELVNVCNFLKKVRRNVDLSRRRRRQH